MNESINQSMHYHLHFELNNVYLNCLNLMVSLFHGLIPLRTDTCQPKTRFFSRWRFAIDGLRIAIAFLPSCGFASPNIRGRAKASNRTFSWICSGVCARLIASETFITSSPADFRATNNARSAWNRLTVNSRRR